MAFNWPQDAFGFKLQNSERLMFLGWLAILEMRDPVALVVVLWCGGVGIVCFAVVVAVPIGWFAHRWFWQSPIPVNRMAAAMALIVDGTVFGWILVIVLDSNR